MEEIKATDEQKRQVKELVKEFRQKMNDLRANTNISEEEKKMEWKKLSDYRQNKYWNEILTLEQSKYLKEKQEKMKEEAKKKS